MKTLRATAITSGKQRGRAHTLYADFPRQDFYLRYTYSHDKEVAKRLGLYTSRRAALSQMRKDVTERIRNLENTKK